jgi:glutamyl-tRNA reductase
MRPIAVVGIDFRNVAQAELERAHARAGGAAALAAAMRAALHEPDELELVALVTCNRIEVYAAAARALSSDELAHAFGVALGAPAFARAGTDAERHLLRVACSLESACVGEEQILGQVRGAFAEARAAGTAGPRLAALFDLALRVGKRVRRETELARLGTDLARLAMLHVKPALRGDAERPLALLGTGAMARAVMAARPKDGRDGWCVVGRDRARTAAFAREFGAEPVALEEFLAGAAPLRALIAATTLREPLIDGAFVRRRLGPDAPVVDLGMPGNVAPEVRGCARLADLTDLRALAETNAARLATTVAQIERWIDDGLVRRAQRGRTTAEALP